MEFTKITVIITHEKTIIHIKIPEEYKTNYHGNLSQHATLVFFLVVRWFNSLCPSDAIWQHRSGSTLAQVWLVAWSHQAITWSVLTYILSMRFSGTHLRLTSQEVLKISILEMSLKNTLVKWCMGWNYLSIPKLQRCNRWSLGMDK